MSHKVITKLSAFFAVIAWLFMAFTDLTVIFSYSNNLAPEISQQVPVIAFNVFLLLLFIYFKIKIERAENVNFIDLLWRVFVTGLVTTIVSLFFRMINVMIGESALAQYIIYQEFVYVVNLGLLSIVLVSCFSVFRKLILYQKSKALITFWRLFQSLLLVGLVYNVLPFTFLNQFSQYYLIVLGLMGLFLSVNIKWVAYLNFKQKWKGILLVALALFYLIYFVWVVTIHSGNFEGVPFVDFQENIFLIALIIFVFIYIIFSLLVLLFNLPTSSVFEQKLEEVGNFQKLSQSIQTEQSEERVYDILLESSVSTVFADAAWLEINQSDNITYYTYQIEEKEVLAIKDALLSNKAKGVSDQGQDKTRNLDLILKKVKGSRFRSLIVAPIVVKNEQIGVLGLLKEVTDGFNKEMKKIVSTFSNQAGISIENFRLLSEALENERYKEELKIAKRVQSSLLPKDIKIQGDYEMVAYSRSAAEVGGDYYDTLAINEHSSALIIGDVSGKGTSAAFHMSQMKGIFQSLSQLGLEPNVFLDKANNALAKCLDKSSFITATYFIIDSKKNTLRFSRAGHCPTLYFDSKKGISSYFSTKGMGLGMLRNNNYINFVEVNEVNYHPDDILILYTDGITEAQNRKGDEYGYDRLKEIVDFNAKKSPEEIKNALIEDFFAFTGTEFINDDYTVVILKFK